jgi:hypothetical protein
MCPDLGFNRECVGTLWKHVDLLISHEGWHHHHTPRCRWLARYPPRHITLYSMHIESQSHCCRSHQWDYLNRLRFQYYYIQSPHFRPPLSRWHYIFILIQIQHCLHRRRPVASVKPRSALSWIGGGRIQRPSSAVLWSSRLFSDGAMHAWTNVGACNVYAHGITNQSKDW